LDNQEEPVEKKLTGDVYGYIRRSASIMDSNGLRIKGRRPILAVKSLEGWLNKIEIAGQISY
jgi:hypothetical protein